MFRMYSSRISILIFFIVIIQSVVAFQQVHHTHHLLHHHTHTHTHTIKTNKYKRDNGNILMLKLMDKSEENSSTRQDFIKQSILSFLISSTTMTISSDESKAAASSETSSSGTSGTSSTSSTSGYIPDMVGGLKKPKGVGGLTKKIRKVGDIMVSLLLLSFLFFDVLVFFFSSI